jgi:hypothetical protein
MVWSIPPTVPVNVGEAMSAFKARLALVAKELRSWSPVLLPLKFVAETAPVNT